MSNVFEGIQVDNIIRDERSKSNFARFAGTLALAINKTPCAPGWLAGCLPALVSCKCRRCRTNAETNRSHCTSWKMLSGICSLALVQVRLVELVAFPPILSPRQRISRAIKCPSSNVPGADRGKLLSCSLPFEKHYHIHYLNH